MRPTLESLLCAGAVFALACQSDAPRGGQPEADGTPQTATQANAPGARDDAPATEGGAAPDAACAGITLPAIDGTFAPEKSAQLVTMGKVASAVYRNKAGGERYDVPALVIEGATTWPSAGGGTNRLAVTYTQMFILNMTALEPEDAADNITRLTEASKKATATELMASPVTLGGKALPGYAFHSGSTAELDMWTPIAGSTKHQLVKIEVSARLNAQCDAMVGEWAKNLFATVRLNENSTFAELETIQRELFEPPKPMGMP